MIAWMTSLAYLVVVALASPWLAWRLFVQRKPIAGWQDKLLGRIERRHPERPCLWFHAVSVGEVLLLQRLLPEIALQRPDAELLITTSTSTGAAVSREKFPHCTIAWFPFDFVWAVRRAFARARCELLVLMELELWPNLLREAERQGVPVMVLNARLGEKSARGYARLGAFGRSMFRRLSLIAAQGDDSAQRFLKQGARADTVHVTGNIKFDRVETDRQHPATQRLAALLGIDRSQPVFVAGSTQDPEETMAIDAWLHVRDTWPGLQLLVVPRHAERFDQVAALIQQRGLRLCRRSECTLPASTPAPVGTVFLLDTLGELSAAWGLADVAFVGGSLTTTRGGQNMLEPAAYGAAVCFGPHTWNFQQIVQALLEREAAVVVRDGNELQSRLAQWLQHPAERQELGERGRRFVLSQQGATTRTIELLAPWISAQASSTRAA